MGLFQLVLEFARDAPFLPVGSMGSAVILLFACDSCFSWKVCLTWVLGWMRLFWNHGWLIYTFFVELGFKVINSPRSADRKHLACLLLCFICHFSGT